MTGIQQWFIIRKRYINFKLKLSKRFQVGKFIRKFFLCNIDVESEGKGILCIATCRQSIIDRHNKISRNLFTIKGHGFVGERHKRC